MKKQIDIKDSIIKDLKIAAAWHSSDLKNFIQDVLIEEAKKNVLFMQNQNERTHCKYLDPVMEEFKTLGIENKKMNLQCVTEGSFIYELNINNCTHEIVVINDNMCFFNKMSITEILSKTPFYLCHRIGLKGGGKIKEHFSFKIGETKEWREKFGE